MKSLLQIVNFLFASILFCVLLSTYTYLLKERPISQQRWFWLLSITSAAIQYLLTGLSFAISLNDPNLSSQIMGASKLFYVIACVCQSLFCLSIYKDVTQKIIKLALIGTVWFAVQYGLLFSSQKIAIQVLEIILVVVFLLVVQAVSLIRSLQKNKSIQIKILLSVTAIELLLALIKLGIVSYRVLLNSDIPTPIEFEQIPIPLVGLAITHLFLSTLSYLTMIGYWSEIATAKKTELRIENEKIRHLLKERDRLIQSLSRANKTALTSALSSTIAHELNQPLCAVQLNIQFLRELMGEGSNTQIKEVLNCIYSENARAHQIVASLREILSDSGLIVAPTEMNILINRMATTFCAKFKSEGIAVSYQLMAKDLVNVNADEIYQVLINLITNSIDALNINNRANRKIIITTKIKHCDFVLSVADNGPGVPASKIDNLFELFNGSTKNEGIGIGLWLADVIVKRHQGKILYRTSQLGGAEISMIIPIQQNTAR
jgi:signal transduction histidine kinase